LVEVRESDHRLKVGDRIEATGWLDAITGPSNPGGFDFRAWARQRGIFGRLTLATRSNWRRLEGDTIGAKLLRWRQGLSDSASRSLRLGMEDDAEAAALLDALLLGRRDADLEQARRAFREVGLVHLLAISGAHVGMLLGLAWLLGRVMFQHPARTTGFVLLVLTAYLLVVPWRAPIVRAGLMAGVFCLGRLCGRRTPAIELLALACVLRLLWQPGELLTAGFQLSFGIVAALILFISRVSGRIWPDPFDPPGQWSTRQVVARVLADYLAVSVIAFGIALPLTALHFRMITPYGWLVTLVALPLATAVLGVGFTKILVGAVLASAGQVLAWPMMGVAHVMLGLAEAVRDWPGATVYLRGGAGWWWTAASLVTACALFGGWFRSWRSAMAAAGLCALWLVWIPQGGSAIDSTKQGDAMRVSMLAVGDGTCITVQLRDAQRGGHGRVWMFDCGAQGYWEVGERTVWPAMRQLGVRRIDTLVVSHPDIDHFCGALDLADRVAIGRVLVSPQFLEKARDHPNASAEAWLLDGLAARGIAIEAVSRGWRETAGDGEVRVLWPPAERRFQHDNDGSIVLSMEVGGRRLLLCGDIGREAMLGLIGDKQPVRADVMELPHHGAFSPIAGRWLAAVQPAYVLQSCGRARLNHDRWRSVSPVRSMRRFITARDGMIDVRVAGDGSIACSTFRSRLNEAGGENQRFASQ